MYQKVLVASASELDDLMQFQPQEDSLPEGSLIELELQYESTPTQEAVDEINLKCVQSSVAPWYGESQIAYLQGNTIILHWVKSIAWMPIILGIVAATILPALLGGLVWLLTPGEVKDTILMMIDMMVMMLMMFVMMQLMKPMMSAMGEEEPPRRVSAKSSTSGAGQVSQYG